jgi:hypothetical protein
VTIEADELVLVEPRSAVIRIRAWPWKRWSP